MTDVIRKPTDNELLTALCCGEECRAEAMKQPCHRWDFIGEARRVLALFNRLTVEPEQPIKQWTFKAHKTNVGPLTIDGVEVVRPDGSALVAGDIVAGHTYSLDIDTGRIQELDHGSR